VRDESARHASCSLSLVSDDVDDEELDDDDEEVVAADEAAGVAV
jgi:hypothetical protein